MWLDYFGPVVNRSARVEGISQGGQIVVTDTVWEKVKINSAFFVEVFLFIHNS